MDISTLPCPVCGGVNYEFGSIEHYRYGTLSTNTKSLYFRRDGIRVQAFGLLNRLMTESPAQVSKGRHCLQCGNIQMFLDKN